MVDHHIGTIAVLQWFFETLHFSYKYCINRVLRVKKYEASYVMDLRRDV
jgi:hypothetical protein